MGYFVINHVVSSNFARLSRILLDFQETKTKINEIIDMSYKLNIIPENERGQDKETHFVNLSNVLFLFGIRNNITSQCH